MTSTPAQIAPGDPPVPTVVDRVHYVSYGTPAGEYVSTCRAAIVTVVEHDSTSQGARRPTVGLCVLNPTGMFFNAAVPYHAGVGHDDTDAAAADLSYPGGTWHWPEHP